MADVTFFSQTVGALPRKVDISTNTLVVGNIKIGGVTTNVTFDLTALTASRSIKFADSNLDLADLLNVYTLSGVAQGATHLGTFTGSTIADSSTIKAALQALETSLELKADSSVVSTISGKVDDLVTLSGVAANSTSLGTFTGVTIPDSSTIKAALQALETEVELKISSSEKGAANGVATLDAGGKVPASQLPNTVMEYQGAWDADTDSPALSGLTPNAGDVYRVSVAGSQDLGDGAGVQQFFVGDLIIYSAALSKFQRSPTADGVVSVFGRQGAVTAQNGDYTASQITNVPAGNIAAVTVQAAINELDSEKFASADFSSSFDTAFSGKTTTDLTEGTNLYFTDERAQDAVGGMVANSSAISLTYTDATPSLVADLVADGVKDSHIDWGTGAGQVSAADMPIADAGTYFPTDDVEAALQSLGSSRAADETAISNLQGAVGASIVSSIDYTSNNYVTDNTSLVAAVSALDAALATVSGATPSKVEEVMVAGETFAANTSFLVRMAVNGETAGRIYKADKGAGAPGSETDHIYVIGLAQNRTGSAITAGSSIPVVKLGLATLQSADTAFAAAEIGKPVFLGASGAFDVWAELTFGTNDAEVRCASVRTTSSVEVLGAAQIMIVN